MTATLGLALLGALAAAAAAGAGKLTIERLFASPDLSGPALRTPRLSPDGRLVAYLQGSDTNRDRLDLWAYDVAARRSRRLIDAAVLVPEERVLSPEEEARRERQRTAALRGIVEYAFAPDSRHVLVPLSGDLYLYDLKAPAAEAVRRLTRTEAYETDAKFSPRGRYVSFVREQNLHAIELATGREIAVTRGGGGPVSYGMAEFIAQEEMDRTTGYWWSPDESRIAYARVDEAGVDEVERFEIDAEAVRVLRQRYPAAGRPNVRIELWVAPLQSPQAAVRAELGAEPDIYLARVDWFPDSTALAAQRQSRDQRRLDLLRIGAADGAATTLLTETSDTWVELNDDMTFLPKRRQLLWASARSGYRHLYLYDLAGRLLRPVTAGDWVLAGDARERAVAGVDEARGLVYFTANRDTPIERHLYVAPLDGPADPVAVDSRIRRISQGAGWHSVRMSRDARLWLDRFSDADAPPSLTLRRADGARIATLVENRLDDAHPYGPYRAAHVPARFGTLRAADGQVLHWQMLVPPGLAPGQRAPAIVEVYGGPGVQRVQRAWTGTAGLYQQTLAQAGYVVFMLDNRGTGARGRAFETALHRRMGTVEIEDQVRGAEYLRTLPFVDPQRIGIWGWSYGGYATLLAMMRAPDHFRAGVSGAPVTDWALYDTHYTERYMDTPAANAAGYSDARVMTHAANLHGPLLVLHGMADDNVLFTNSTALFKRLQDLGKPFVAMPYPGSKHALLRFPATGPHAFATITRFFDENLRDAR